LFYSDLQHLHDESVAGWDSVRSLETVKSELKSPTQHRKKKRSIPSKVAKTLST